MSSKSRSASSWSMSTCAPLLGSSYGSAETVVNCLSFLFAPLWRREDVVSYSRKSLPVVFLATDGLPVGFVVLNCFFKSMRAPVMSTGASGTFCPYLMGDLFLRLDSKS